MKEIICATIATAIISPTVCVLVYIYWKGSREIKKTMRRNELVETIKNDWEVKKAITELIIDKAKTDYQFQQAVVLIMKERA